MCHYSNCGSLEKKVPFSHSDKIFNKGRHQGQSLSAIIFNENIPGIKLENVPMGLFCLEMTPEKKV